MSVTVIVGPTGSGKSDLAYNIAGDHVIINADAQQVYKSLPTLRATPASQVNYRMYAYLDDHQRTNAVEWANKAAKLISENNDTVVVGGTALYIETLLSGAPPVPVTPPDVKQYVSSLNDDALKTLVFRSTADFRFKDRHRMERAAGVFLATGRPITEWQQLPRAKYNIGPYTVVYTQPPTKPALHQRILIMLKMGALDEVRNVHDTDKIPVTPIGLDSAMLYLRNEISRDRMVTLWTDAMYQYSRRQYRFFNKLRKVLATQDSK